MVSPREAFLTGLAPRKSINHGYAVSARPSLFRHYFIVRKLVEYDHGIALLNAAHRPLRVCLGRELWIDARTL